MSKTAVFPALKRCIPAASSERMTSASAKSSRQEEIPLQRCLTWLAAALEVPEHSVPSKLFLTSFSPQIPHPATLPGKRGEGSPSQGSLPPVPPYFCRDRAAGGFRSTSSLQGNPSSTGSSLSTKTPHGTSAEGPLPPLSPPQQL